MEEAIVSTSGTPRKRRRWLRLFLWLAVLLVLLVVGGYFLATSSAFLKIVVLPRVSSAIGAEVTVGDIAVHPFKEVSLSDLKVQTKGQEPLLKAGEVRARYDLMEILRGNIHVGEITISSPAITLVENPDGTSNLDPILKALAAKPREAEAAAHKPSKPSKPPQVDLAKLSLSDATIQRTKLYGSGSRDVAELSHVNISLDRLRNGQSGKLTIGANIKLDSNPPAPGTNGVLEAKLDGSFTFALTADLNPGSLQGSTRVSVSRAEGAFAQGGGLGADLECELTPGEIKQVALQFQKGNVRLGQLRASGPFDVAKLEGRLKVEILSIDKQVLNLAGAASGIDFGDTTLNCTNEIELAAGGSNLSASGQVALDKLQFTRAHQKTPELDIHAAYDVAIDRAGQSAVLRRFTLSGTQQGKRLINADLTTPMTLAWGAAANAVGDSSITLAVTNLDLADWKPFLGENPPSGQVVLTLALLSKKAGKQLTFDLDSGISTHHSGGSSIAGQRTVG